MFVKYFNEREESISRPDTKQEVKNTTMLEVRCSTKITPQNVSAFLPIALGPAISIHV